MLGRKLRKFRHVNKEKKNAYRDSLGNTIINRNFPGCMSKDSDLRKLEIHVDNLSRCTRLCRMPFIYLEIRRPHPGQSLSPTNGLGKLKELCHLSSVVS